MRNDIRRAEEIAIIEAILISLGISKNGSSLIDV